MLDFQAHGRADRRLRQQHPPGRAGRRRRRTRSTSRASCRPTSARCSAEGIGPFRWVALSGDPEDIYKTDAKVKELFPRQRAPAPLARHGPRAHRLPGPAGAHLLGRPGRAPPRSAWPSTRWCASGELKAPIVIGRDHLDSGSVASPNRETEAMRDGSDAVSDWPLLNALLNTAGGATWVSLHHGGGVGMGYSQHAGMVIVADGTRSGRQAPGARAVERPRHRRHAPRRCRLRDRDRSREALRPEPADDQVSSNEHHEQRTASPDPATRRSDAGRPARRLAGRRQPGRWRRQPTPRSRPRPPPSRPSSPRAIRPTASTPASASWPSATSRRRRLETAAAQPDPVARGRHRRAAARPASCG